jgi:signal transduction histidine kinase
MGLATNSRKRKPVARRHGVTDINGLLRRLRALAPGVPVPLLIVRVKDLERVAWREGRAAARIVERRSLRSFVDSASRQLRASDLLAHDDDSEDFVAALVSRNRTTGTIATPMDCRAALARLSSAMELAGGMRVETGWAILYGTTGDPHLSKTIEGALERGARERERYDFFSTIGHELRTPLTSIRGYLETLLDNASELDEATTRRFLEIARAEALRLGRLVDGMFDVSMLDLRAGAPNDESSDLATTVASAIDAVMPFAYSRASSIIRLSTITANVAIDADRLAQVLINLLDNAIKHGRAGGRVYVSLSPIDARFVEVRIDDDGPGVPVAERESIFSLAQRGANAQGKGSGIGLAVARLVIERNGGGVDVTESLLGGAQFRVRVPLVVPSAERGAEATPPIDDEREEPESAPTAAARTRRRQRAAATPTILTA